MKLQKNYNSKIASENKESHISALNKDNLEDRILDLFEKGYELEAKKEIHSKIVFLYQRIVDINKSGKQDWSNSIKNIKLFYNQVYNDNFKNNPHHFVNKAIDFLTAWTSRLGMGFNLHSAIKNIATGVNQNLIEASSLHYSRNDISKASVRVLSLLHTFVRDWSLGKNESTTKEGAIFKNLPLFQSIRVMSEIGSYEEIWS